MLEIVKPGLMTTVQDEGRFGEYHIGMPPSGAMDKFSYRVANMLVGNEPGAACLECTYFGPEIVFTEPTTIALTGADLPARLNGEPLESWTSHEVRADDVLSFDYLRSGARVYLGVAGGIDVAPVLGSRSTYTLTGTGGLDGRPLKAGDVLKTGVPQNGTAAGGKSVPEALRPGFPTSLTVRVVVGLASYRVVPDSLAAFFDTDWTVSSEANRVGYRYRGGSVDFVERRQPAGAGSDPSNVVDIGYPIGSIQVPGGSEPIALLNDAVTGGGYATIATIISTDLDVVGQSRTNDVTRFEPVSLEAALQARSERRDRLSAIAAALSEQG